MLIFLNEEKIRKAENETDTTSVATLLKTLFPLFLHPDNETRITNNFRPLVFKRVYIKFKIFR